MVVSRIWPYLRTTRRNMSRCCLAEYAVMDDPSLELHLTDFSVSVQNQQCIMPIDINRTPVSKTRPLSSYQLTHDKMMLAWTRNIHTTAWQEPTGGPLFILYSTQSSSYIYRYTVLIRDYYYIAIYTLLSAQSIHAPCISNTITY